MQQKTRFTCSQGIGKFVYHLLYQLVTSHFTHRMFLRVWLR